MATIVDLRGLDPPEPLFRILDTLDTGPGGPHVFLLAREPLPLYAMLRASGWRHRSRHIDEGCEVTVFRGEA